MSTVCAGRFEAVPDELKALRQWVGWRYEERPGEPKPTKVPLRASRPAVRASSTDPRTWTTFEEAVSVHCAGNLDGIGFVLDGGGIIGIDLDGVLDDGVLTDGELATWVAALGGYVEHSPSGTGLHILGRGILPEWSRNRRGSVEVYSTARFVTVTGAVFEGLSRFGPLRELEAFLEAHGLRREESSSNGQPLPVVPVDVDDEELLEKAMSARNGAAFSRLWAGDAIGYESASERDLALASLLMFWTGRDVDRVDRMFRASGCYREKWERSSYRLPTLEAALAGTTEVYTPSAISSPPARITPDAVEANTPPSIDPDLDLVAGFPFTDLGNARRFAAMHRGRFLYARTERVWLEWRDGRWRRDVTGAAERAAKETVEALWERVVKLPDEQREKAAKWAIASQSEAKLRAMLSLASTEAELVVRLEALDSDPWLLSCGNGTLDLRTGTLRVPDPADLISRGTDVNYVPDAPRPRWDRFQEEVFASDRDLMHYVKRAYGSCMTGDTRDRPLFIEHGSHCNGKSTFNRVFSQALGPDLAQAAPIRLVMRGRGSEIPNEVARLHRARFVVIAETADGRRLNENQVKALTGRDRIPARFLHQEWFEFEPEFKLVLYTNYKPKIDGSDAAIWDRVKLIPFNVSFAEREDKTLGEKLLTELEGVLAWAVEGCLEWARDGLGTCDAVERATQAYRSENDVLGRFLAEHCEFDENATVSKTTLRSRLKSYCEEEGEEELTAVWIGRYLSEHHNVTGVKKLYRGLRLTDEGES